MMIKIYYLTLISLLFISCGSIKAPTVNQTEIISNYKYIYVVPTEAISSNTGNTINNQYYSRSKNIIPSEVIIGNLIKQNFIRLDQIDESLKEQTLIINYGESGRRNVGLGYAIEITLQFINAKNKNIIASCSAEGLGQTEADDIRIAIDRCLSAIKY